jgi:ADP-heptose:LPS heptosyltransferase
MHLLESYALLIGQQISSCFIDEEVIILPEKKYVTLHTEHAKGSSRKYNYWDEVVDYLLSNKNFNFDIIQIGQNKEEKNTKLNYSYLGETNYNSLAYLIKNSEMHIGYDSLPVHLASHYGKKIVAIYPHYKQYSGPFFSNENDICILEPNYPINQKTFKKIKPSYSNHGDLMNTILPKDIYLSILKILKINE